MSEEEHESLLALCTILMSEEPNSLGLYLKYDMSANLKQMAPKLNGWEAEAERECLKLVTSKKVQASGMLGQMQQLAGDEVSSEKENKAAIKAAAGAIGAIVAKQVYKGNYDALDVIREGLENLAANRDFKGKAGRQKTRLAPVVELALRQLQGQGIERPSQKKILAHINGAGVKMGKAQLSKILDDLGLKGELGDAPKATRQASKRERKET